MAASRSLGEYLARADDECASQQSHPKQGLAG